MQGPTSTAHRSSHNNFEMAAPREWSDTGWTIMVRRSIRYDASQYETVVGISKVGISDWKPVQQPSIYHFNLSYIDYLSSKPGSDRYTDFLRMVTSRQYDLRLWRGRTPLFRDVTVLIGGVKEHYHAEGLEIQRLCSDLAPSLLQEIRVALQGPGVSILSAPTSSPSQVTEQKILNRSRKRSGGRTRSSRRG